MNCEHIETKLIAYLDGKANPAQRREVEAHLAGCAPCEDRVTEFRALWSVLDELPEVSPSPSFDAAVRARVAAEPGRETWWSWLAPSPRMAFATVALVVVSGWLFSIQPTLQPVRVVAQAAPSESEFGMIKNLPVLEDYDVLSDFDALSDLPVQQAARDHLQRP